MRPFRLAIILVILIVMLPACKLGRSTPALSPTLAQPGASKAPSPDNPVEVTSVPGEPGTDLVLLNEVLFLPQESAPQFIELKNPGKSAVQPRGMQLTNEKGTSYTLPADTGAIPAEGTLLILFDGKNQVDQTAVHSNLAQFLDTQSGFVALSAPDGASLDRASWGEQLYPVRLSRGGRLTDLIPGTSIGRFPLSSAIDPQEWVTFAPDQVTPGAVNPTPGVEALLPLSGAILTSPGVELSWYPVAGATQYRVQLASDIAFTNPAIDQAVTSPPLKLDQLASGDYYWRVQAIAADGSTASFSQPNAITIVSKSSAAHLAAPAKANPLAVPMIIQHKDTAMLMLESQKETGAHAWDVDHKTLDQNDPSDNMNCGLASTAMVNAFYGGKLSQDRIGYEIFKDRQPGPEQDLNYGYGLTDSQQSQALKFALGTAPSTHKQPYTAAQFWTDIKNEIDAGRPVVATTPMHVFVITGYATTNGKQLITINDPWSRSYQVDLANPQASALNNQFDTYFLLPAAVAATSDEPEIRQDSDGDGVVDFDETQRFHTNPNDADTDHDKVKDKQDLRASIFDTIHGYAFGHPEGRDVDKDNIPKELDEDSDGGGCFDGLEDQNGNGKYEASAKETDNFLSNDDACIWGSDESFYDITTLNDNTTRHVTTNILATFSLKPANGNQLQGLARIKVYNVGGDETDSRPGNNCPLVNFSTDPQEWGAVLKGQSFSQPDGSVQVVFQATPGQGPSQTWAFSGCGPATQEYPGVLWQTLSGQLVNGVYDYRQDNQIPENSTGIFYTLIHMEQKKKE
jgi:hypothetical protein